MNEEIRKEISDQLDEKLGKDLSVHNLALKAQYKTLIFFGLADGTNMDKQFIDADLIGRTMIIKSFRMIPFTAAGATVVDFSFFDGATTTKETLNAIQRLSRLFDVHNLGFNINFRINGARLGMFSQNPAFPLTAYPSDLTLENIYYKFPAKISTINLAVTGQMWADFTAGVDTTFIPTMKVLIECYLI